MKLWCSSRWCCVVRPRLAAIWQPSVASHVTNASQIRDGKPVEIFVFRRLYVFGHSLPTFAAIK